MTKSVELTDKLRRLIFINILISVIASSMLRRSFVHCRISFSDDSAKVLLRWWICQ